MKKTLKRALCGIFVLVFMLANANIALAGDMIIFSSDIMEPELHNTASNGSFDNLESYVGDIDEFQEYLLNCIMTDDSNIANGNQVGYIDISQYNIPYNDFTSVELSKLIWYESPELFRIDSIGYSYTMSGKLVSITPYYRISSPDEFKLQYDVFVDVSEKMLIGIKDNPTLSDVEKALLLHDRLAEYCEYDYENYLAGAVPDSSYSAQGVFCMGTAVCMGYTLAYDYLLEQVGIESEYCSSSSLNHAWNIVYIDNSPYYVDVTWDDPTWDVSGSVYHDEFLVSPTVFKQSHNAADYKTISTDTTYDNAFWRKITTAVQLVNDKLYYINDSQRIVVIDDITDTTPEEIANVNLKWYIDGGSYYTGMSKLASLRGKLYYSGPKEVYCYDPVTKKTTTVITEQESLDKTGDEYFNIYGITAFGCHVWGEYSDTPVYNEYTKKTHVFSLGYHNPTENWKVVIEPTYTSEGKEKKYCVDCGAELGSRLIPAIDDQHTWTDWYIDVNNPPTCTEKGVELRDCSHCGAQEWRYGTELGHNYSSSYTVDWEATCKDKGRKSRHCTRCDSVTDATEIPITNIHIKGDAWIKGKTPTCKEEGYNYKVCKICGVEMEREILSKTSHIVKISNAISATCTKDGYTGDSICEVCGSNVNTGKVIPATGHKASGWIVDKQPTATEKGSKHKECTVCKEVLETESLDEVIVLSTPISTTKNTAKGITVTWGAVENAEKYIVYQRVYNKTTKKYSGWKAIKTTTDLTYTDTTVKLGTKYSYTVKAVTGSVKSGIKATSGLTYNVTPTVKVAVASNGIKVSWSTAANATGYTVYSSTYNTKTKKWSGWTNRGTTKANATSWVDKKAKSGTKYRYTVKAMNDKVGSTYNKDGAATLYLAQPTVKIANNASGVKVAWNKIAGATGYTIYRSELSNGKWTSWKNMGTIKKNSTVSWVDKSAKSGTQYRYTVRAINGSVKSTYKASNTLLYLAQPTVSFTNASNGMNVSWNAIPGATGYTVYSATYNAKTKKWSGWSKRGTTTKTSWTDTKVTSGTYYKYTVKAVDGKTSSTYKVTSGLIRLAQPTVTTSVVSGSVKVSWNKITGATGYRIYRKANDETKWSTVATVTGTSYTDVKIADGNSYTYTVRAYKGKVWSSYNTTGETVTLDSKKEVFNLVNAERKKAGLEPLEYYSVGQEAGDIRAKEIAKEFSHTRPDGTMCFTVFDEIGVSYYSAGENIAWGYLTPEVVMDGWMNSPGHKANILNPDFTHIIVGYDATSNSWVQLFLGNPYTE